MPIVEGQQEIHKVGCIRLFRGGRVFDGLLQFSLSQGWKSVNQQTERGRRIRIRGSYKYVHLK